MQAGSGCARKILGGMKVEREGAARGDGQGVGQPESARVLDIDLRVPSEARAAVMRCERRNVSDRLLHAAADKSQTEGHYAAADRSRDEQIGCAREAGDASGGEHEFDVSGAHSACEIEDQKRQAAEDSGGQSGEELAPSAKREVKHKAYEHGRDGDEIRDAATGYIEGGANDGTGCGDRKTRRLGM
jgi:hypothetical protein